MSVAHAPDSLWFEDLTPGMRGSEGPYRVEAEEMLAFAAKWDPLPIHAGDAAGVHGQPIAPGTYTLAVKQHLLTRNCPWGSAVIGAIQHDQMRFLKPVRAGDELSFHWEVRESRPSRSKPDRGITTFHMALTRADGETVLDYIDTVMLARRPG